MAKPDILPPRENHQLFGFEQAEQQFIQEFAAGKTHHAYLMTGPKGIGKATLAYRFARHILGTGAVQAAKQDAGFSLFGDEPAAELPATLGSSPDDALFRRIAAGSHTDLLTLTPAYDKKKDAEKSIISVDDARKVPGFLSLTPAEGDWRVVIVDAVDQLNPNAANALLKILEEPPEAAILLLVCHEPGAILPTIKSRCRKFVLTAPPRAAFDKALMAVAPHIDPSEYSALHALSNGSPGHAITLEASGGLKRNGQWLAALQPEAGPATRQRFIDSAAAQKTPETWRAILYAWNVAITRISLWPHASGAPILGGEGELIAAIAEPLSPQIRQQWAGKARNLIAATDIFNLDKRQSLAMLMQPGLLDRLAA